MKFVPLLVALCAPLLLTPFLTAQDELPPPTEEEPGVVLEPTAFEAAVSFAANTEALPQIEDQIRALQDQVASLQSAAAGDRAILEQSISADRPIRAFDLGGGKVVVTYFAGTSTQIRVLEIEGPDVSSGENSNGDDPPEPGQ